MLSKCVNLACSAQFHYLHEGKVFRLDTGTLALPDGHPNRKTEYFWLCDRCAKIMTVVFDNGKVATRPLHPQRVEAEETLETA